MSFGFVLLGLMFLGLGFFMVWKTNLWLQWFGDIGTMLGFYNASWLSWKSLGIIFMLFGFLLATGLIGLFFRMTLGRLFFVGF